MTTYVVDAGLTPAVTSNAAAITAQTTALTTAFTALTAQLTAMNTLNETKYWGTAALAVPASPAASLAIIASQLVDINENLREIKDKSTALQGSLSDLSNSVKAQTQAVQASCTLQSMAVQDQIMNNAFAKAETIAALQRNGIEPQPAPDILNMLKANLASASQFTISTNFVSGLNSLSNTCISTLSSFITNSAAVTWAQDKLTNLWAALGINKLKEAAVNPTVVAAEAAQKVRSAAARSGVWTGT